MRIFISFLLTAIPFICFSQQSIYDIEIDSIGGQSKIKLQRFKDTKLVIVNTASFDTGFSQVQELKKLKQMNAGKLSILIVPSNDFNTEPASEAAIISFLSKFSLPFVVTKKVHVKGRDMHPLYQWLTRKSLNNKEDSEVKGAFQKYIVSKNGKLVGVFAPSIRPIMNKDLKDKIEKDEN